jgi:hypothetical protein
VPDASAPDPRIEVAANHGRASLTAGATLDDVLRTFRDADGLGAIECVVALRLIAPIELACCKLLISEWCEGRSYAHLLLADLDLLADAPRIDGVEAFLSRYRDEAIIDRQPWLLFARDRPGSVHTLRSRTPLTAFPSPPERSACGSILGATVTYEAVAAKARVSAAAWPAELAIERDHADEMMLRSIRVP